MGTILSIRNLNKSFGALKATDDLNLDVEDGTIHALIGPNGAGKSTLVAQLSGYLEPDSGDITFDGVDLSSVAPARRAHIGLVRSFQITSIFPELTALDNVCVVLQSMNHQVFNFWKPAASDRAERAAAQELLDRVGLGGESDRVSSELAHGQQRQLEVAMALAMKPRVLLLDEPMAGMGVEEGRHLINLLKDLRHTTTILLIEHDMDAVFSLADRVSVLVYGRIIATDTPAAIRQNEEVQSAYLGTHEIHDEGAD